MDDEAVVKANLIVVGYKPQIFLDKQAEFHDRLERGLVKAEDLQRVAKIYLTPDNQTVAVLIPTKKEKP